MQDGVGDRRIEAYTTPAKAKKEIDDIAQRMYVAKMLSEQAVYSKIVERTGASTATISRVNRAFNYGRGAYAKILAKVEEEKD